MAPPRSKRNAAPPVKSKSTSPNALGAKVKPPSAIVPGTPQGGTGGPAGSWGRLPR